MEALSAPAARARGGEEDAARAIALGIASEIVQGTVVVHGILDPGASCAVTGCPTPGRWIVSAIVTAPERRLSTTVCGPHLLVTIAEADELSTHDRVWGGADATKRAAVLIASLLPIVA